MKWLNLAEVELLLQHPAAHLASFVLIQYLTPTEQWRLMPLFSAAVAILACFYFHEIVPKTLVECQKIILDTQDFAKSSSADIIVTRCLNLGSVEHNDLYQRYQIKRRWPAVDFFGMMLVAVTMVKCYGKTEDCDNRLVVMFATPALIAACMKIALPARTVAMDEVLNFFMLGSLWMLNLSTAFVNPSGDCMLGAAIWESPPKTFCLTFFQTMLDLLLLSFNLRYTPIALFLIMLAMIIRGSVLLHGHWGVMQTEEWALEPYSQPCMLIGGVLVLPVLYASCLAGYIRVRMESRRIKQFIEAGMTAD
eukprot:scaffold259099_cov35-Prasinocladus_malaysianus.AAC.2